MPGAKIRISGDNPNGPVRDTTTDSSGRFEITGLPPGSYKVALLHDREFDPDPLEQNIDIEDTADCIEVFFLSHPAGRVEAIVRDAAGRPAARLAVEVLSQSKPGIAFPQSGIDELGRFAARHLMPGNYLFRVRLDSSTSSRAPSYVYFPGKFDNAEGQVIRVEHGDQIELPALTLPLELVDHLVEGYVFLPEGAPAEGAKISVWQSGALQTTTADRHGYFRGSGPCGSPEEAGRAVVPVGRDE